MRGGNLNGLGDFTSMVADLAASRAEVERLRDYVKDIARQKLTDEMDEEMQDSADYEGAYESIVKEAREALAKGGGHE